MHYAELEHQDRGKHCLSFVVACPAEAIEYEGDSFQIDIHKCLEKGECLICIKACPTGALVLRGSEKPKKEKIG